MTYEYGTTPFDHQREEFERTKDLAVHARLWEQGTGKTKPTIDEACYLFETGQIDGVVVVAPTGVHRNWANDEIPTHLPERLKRVTQVHYWQTVKQHTKWHAEAIEALTNRQGFSWLLMTYEGFMTDKGKMAVWKFLKRRRCLYVLDEAHHIKTPNAKRTKSIIASGKYADRRRILTGTPLSKPFDLYSQIRFLDPDLWARRHVRNFYAFKQHFAEWFTAEDCKILNGYDPGYDRLVEYKNMDELQEILASVSSRLLKEDVLDLPPKLYTKRRFELSRQQRRLYDRLRNECELEYKDGTLERVELAIVRLLRLHQITCGYIPSGTEEPDEKIDGPNPRLDEAVGFFTELNHQAIIWARFRQDVDQLVDALPGAVRYDGAVSEDEAERAKQAFNAGDAGFFVGNPSKGAEGITLNAAKTTGFYSCDFRLIKRLQAEDRNHRIGQDGADHGEHGFGVLYADFMAEDTVDEKIIMALRSGFDIAAQLMGDRFREWI